MRKILFPLVVVLVAGIGLGCASRSSDQTESGAAPRPEMTLQEEGIRGVWITNVDSDLLTSKQKIAEAMDFLAAHNFNVVYPVVWNKSYTLYPSEVMEREFGAAIDPLYGDRDPLQELIVEAHRVGIEVVPWFEFGFADSYNTAPEGEEPSPVSRILQKYPEWASLTQEGELTTKNKFRWLDPFNPEVQAFIESLVLEVAENYDIDGIQGDDRLPALPTTGGYNPEVIAKYRAEFGVDPPEDYKDPQWVQWRADLLSDWFAGLREKVKAIDEDIIISSSPSYYDWSLYEYLQDSYTWTNRGIVDSIHPQAYRYDVPAYKSIVDDLVNNQFTEEQLELLAPGMLIKLGSYRIAAEDLRESIAYNRENGIMGEVFFFYPGLRENDNELSTMLVENFYQEPAQLPYRDEDRRPGGFFTQAAEATATGSWEQNPNDDRMMQLQGGLEGGTLVYDAEVPVDGVYDVYTYMRGGPQHTQRAVYNVRGSGLTVMDQSDRSSVGWLKIGQVRAKAGEHPGLVTLEAGESSSDRVTFAGPVMLLLNRKETPDQIW